VTHYVCTRPIILVDVRVSKDRVPSYSDTARVVRHVHTSVVAQAPAVRVAVAYGQWIDVVDVEDDVSPRSGNTA